VRHQCFADDFVFEVKLHLAIIGEVLEEGADIAGVHLTCVVRNSLRQVERSDDGDALHYDGFIGLGQLAVAAAFCRQVHDD